MIYLTVIACLEALLVAGLVVALMLERKATAELLAHFENLHQQERNRLVAAIQRPDIVQPVGPARQRSAEDAQKDRERARSLASVGTISHAKSQ